MKYSSKGLANVKNETRPKKGENARFGKSNPLSNAYFSPRIPVVGCVNNNRSGTSSYLVSLNRDGTRWDWRALNVQWHESVLTSWSTLLLQLAHVTESCRRAYSKFKKRLKFKCMDHPGPRGSRSKSQPPTFPIMVINQYSRMTPHFDSSGADQEVFWRKRIGAAWALKPWTQDALLAGLCLGKKLSDCRFCPEHKVAPDPLNTWCNTMEDGSISSMERRKRLASHVKTMSYVGKFVLNEALISVHVGPEKCRCNPFLFHFEKDNTHVISAQISIWRTIHGSE